jgi:alkanesulfonate monooxygenase
VGIEVFSTCHRSKGVEGAAYPAQLADVARWSEDAGCQGSLVYSDNSLVDPWLVAQLVIQATTTLCPLVAVQPVYLHRTRPRRWSPRSATSTGVVST